MNKLLVLVALILVIAIGGVAFGAFMLNTPANAAAFALSNAFGDFLERDEFQDMGKVLTNGSIQATVEGIEADGEDVLEGGSLSGKVYFSKEAIMLDEIDINLFDVEIAGGAYVSEDMMYVEEENILGGAYGVNIKDFADDFADSIFAPGSGSEYELPEEVYDKVEAMLESLSQSYEEKDSINKDLKKLYKTLVKDIWEIIVENADITSEKTSVRLQGSKEDVLQIVVKIDDDAMENIVSDIYDYLCDSEEIVEFLEKYEDVFNPMFQTITDDEDKYIAEAYEELLEEAEEYIDDVCDIIGNGGFEDITVKIATPKIFPKLLKMDVSVGKTSVFVLDFGKDGIKNTDTIEVEMAGIKLVYNINEDTDNKFDASITVSSDYGDESFELALVIDKKRDKYTASFDAGSEGGKYSIKGKYEESGNTITMSVDELIGEYDGETYTINVDSEIIIKLKDKMPAPNKDFNTIADIDEKDIEGWIEKFGAAEAAPAPAK